MIKESTKVPTIKVTDGSRIRTINVSAFDDKRRAAGWYPVGALVESPVIEVVNVPIVEPVAPVKRGRKKKEIIP